MQGSQKKEDYAPRTFPDQEAMRRVRIIQLTPAHRAVLVLLQ